MPYQGRQPGVGVRNRFVYTATAAQTTFSGADDNGRTLAYQDGAYVDVYLNGVMLVATTDFTATTKTSISLTAGAAASDIVEILAYDISSIADTVSKSQGGTFDGSITVNGSLSVDGGTIKLDGNYPVGDNNVALGNTALSSGSLSGAQNIAVGHAALVANTTGSDNVGVGHIALFSNTTGGQNTAIGRQALQANTTANNNTAVGYQALYTNATGESNVAIGLKALYSNTTSNNTAVGYEALEINTTGTANVAVGLQAMEQNTTGGDNVAVGFRALEENTTASGNTAIGFEALTTNTTAANNTAVGYKAGFDNVTGTRCTFIGKSAGENSTVSDNTFVGENSGSAITTGDANTILGRFSGNEGGLDIRTSSNNIVLSDGDGNPRLYFNSGAWKHNQDPASVGALTLSFTGDILFYAGDAGGVNAAATVLAVQKRSSTGRSINAAGTINASGADYAEYMTKAGDFTVSKGDVVGINAEGKLTNVFADAVSFVVKSTDPSYVGGDTWGVKSTDKDAEQYTEEELEAERQKVDRIAFAGQVPVNVTGATAGQYIVPVEDNGAIKGVAKNEADLTMSDYIKSVGKVIAIEADGRAKIIVKVA